MQQSTQTAFSEERRAYRREMRRALIQRLHARAVRRMMREQRNKEVHQYPMQSTKGEDC